MVGERVELLREPQPSRADEFRDELAVVDDLEAAAEVGIFVRERVEAVRAGRDDLPDAVALERLEVRLRADLEGDLASDAPRGVAGAALLGAEHGEVDAAGLQHLGHRARDLHVAVDHGARAADPEQPLGGVAVAEHLQVEVREPRLPVAGSADPRVHAVVEALQELLHLRAHARVGHHQRAPHVDDLRHVLDVDRALALTGAAGTAAPEFHLEHRRRRIAGAADTVERRNVGGRRFCAAAASGEERRPDRAEMVLQVPDQLARARAARRSGARGTPPRSGRSSCRRRGRGVPSTRIRRCVCVPRRARASGIGFGERVHVGVDQPPGRAEVAQEHVRRAVEDVRELPEHEVAEEGERGHRVEPPDEAVQRAERGLAPARRAPARRANPPATTSRVPAAGRVRSSRCGSPRRRSPARRRGAAARARSSRRAPSAGARGARPRGARAGRRGRRSRADRRRRRAASTRGNRCRAGSGCPSILVRRCVRSRRPRRGSRRRAAGARRPEPGRATTAAAPNTSASRPPRRARSAVGSRLAMPESPQADPLPDPPTDQGTGYDGEGVDPPAADDVPVDLTGGHRGWPRVLESIRYVAYRNRSSDDRRSSPGGQPGRCGSP